MSIIPTRVPVVVACALALATLTPSPTPATAQPAEPVGPSITELDLSGIDPAAVAALPATVPTDEDAVGRPAVRRSGPDVLTPELDVDPFTVLGVTWDAASADDVTISYRVRQDGVWTDWAAVDGDVAPDADGSEAGDGRRTGTDPVVAVGADGLQVWAQAAQGTVTGLKALLVDPGPTPDGATAAAEPATAARPGLITRAGWGANESLVTCEPDLTTEYRTAAVHHTATTNSYSAAQVPGILNSILAYHTRPEAAGGRGWCDIGYNFLVDRYGRIFEGRGGSIDRAVVGVHTGGFNSRTIGIAALGTFGADAPPAVTEALAQVIAWKFGQYRIHAGANVELVSGGGASKFPAGTKVLFPTIYGHRDAQLTACPGQALYDALPAIRARVAALANAVVDATPVGALDQLTATPAGVRVAGWALDLGNPDPLQVRITTGATTRTVTASAERPDVGAAHPAEGSRHGFDVTVPLPAGRYPVCVTALNTGAGVDREFGCRHATVTNQRPIGSVDSVRGGIEDVRVRGWALDKDSQRPISVHIYVDGKLAQAVRADGARPDVARIHGTTGTHGYDVTIPTAAGSHEVCVYAINTPAGSNPRLGCSPARVGNTAPIGHLDAATAGAGTIRVSGWTLDHNTTQPLQVHVYLDGKSVRAVTANGNRPDVARIHGTTGTHGYATTIPASPGRHTVCTYAINVPSGSNPRLGCLDTQVPNTPPRGALDTARGGPSGIRVSGWALDHDSAQPIQVHLYLDGKAVRAVTANGNRPDVARIHGTTGTHGFTTTIPATRGNHTVCAYAINTPTGPNPHLGCRPANQP